MKWSLLITIFLYSGMAFGQACVASNTQSCTPNVQLALPFVNAPNWNVPLVQNFTLLDQLLSGNANLSALKFVNGTISGNIIFDGNLTVNNLDNVIYVGSKYSTVAAAYAAINPGQVVVVPCGSNGPPYAETLAANLVLGKAQTGIWFECGGALTLGPFNIQVPAGVNGVSITSLFGKNSSPGGSNAGFTLTGYTGTGAAVQVGASTADTVDFTMKGIGISMSSAGAGAVGIQLNRTQDFYLENPAVAGMVASANVGIQINGTGSGSYAGNGAIIEPVIFGGGATNQIGIQGTGPSVGSPQGMNAVRIFGGHISLNGASGTSACFDFFAANGNGIFWTDCENAANGLTIEATQNPAILNSFLRIENVTNIVNFAAGTDGNKFSTDNVTGAIINSGLTHNQVFQPLQTNTPQITASGSATVDLASVASGACTADSSDVTLTGASVGDPVRVTAATALPAGVQLIGRVTASNTGRFQLCNWSGGAVDRASDTYTISVVK